MDSIVSLLHSNSQWESQAAIFPGVNLDCDAVIGYNLLRYFRITIDYARQRILFEPFNQSVVRILEKNETLAFDGTSGTTRISLPKGHVLFRYADRAIELSAKQNLPFTALPNTSQEIK